MIRPDLYALVVFALLVTVNAEQCRDEAGNPVDWYVLYKLPKLTETTNHIIRSGLGYLYITSDTVAKGWQMSTTNISAANSFPAQTLAPLYDRKTSDEKMWALYNDSPPNGQANGKYGHAKGAVYTNGSKGFWLIHSVPNYPAVPVGGETPPKRATAPSTTTPNPVPAIPVIAEGEYDYPSTGRNNGQSFLCISLGTDQFETVATQLMYNQIIVYRRSMPQNLREQYPRLTNAFSQVRIKTAPYTNKATLRSLASVPFVSFAKSSQWQKDLYDEFVAPQLQADLYTETWLNGRGRLPSDCHGMNVFNIVSVTLPAADVEFNSSRDHSKWAVATNRKAQRTWVCIGDINRADTQYGRGGGTVCVNSADLWSNYREAVNDVEPCPI